jgi:signal transduction histidine kinase
MPYPGGCCETGDDGVDTHSPECPITSSQPSHARHPIGSPIGDQRSITAVPAGGAAREVWRVVEQLPLLSVLTDADDRVLAANHTFCSLTRLSAWEIVGASTKAILGERAVGPVTDEIHHTTTMPVRGARPLTIRWHVVPMEDSPSLRLLVGTDLTDQVRQARLLDATGQVERAASSGSSMHELGDTICRLARGVVDAVTAVLGSATTTGFDLWNVDTQGIGEGSPHFRRARICSTIEEISAGRLSCIQAATGILFGPSIVAPLGGSKPGFLIVADRPGHPPFSDKDSSAVQLLAEATGTAISQIDRVRSTAVEDDRERIAMDMHDNVMQQLYATGLTLAASARRTDLDPPLRQVLHRAVAHLDRATSDLQASIEHLRVNREGNLAGELHAEVEELTDGAGLVTAVEVDDDLHVGDEAGDALVAIVRSAVTNVLRHAAAERLWVSVHAGDDLVLTVCDDGAGVHDETQAGRGIANMQRRAAALGGTLEMVDACRDFGHQGTCVVWRVPLDRADM